MVKHWGVMVLINDEKVADILLDQMRFGYGS